MLLDKAGGTLDLKVVRRWSRAKHGDAEEAERCLRAHLAWRADFVPGGSISEVQPLHVEGRSGDCARSAKVARPMCSPEVPLGLCCRQCTYPACSQHLR